MSIVHENMLIKLSAQADKDGIVGYDKEGALFSKDAVRENVIIDVNSGEHIKRRVNNMTNDIDNASSIVDKSYDKFDRSLNRLMSKQSETSESVKKISGKVRDSTQKLSDGLAKIEKLANFERLEKYVLLLERAEKAISSLAELEKTGTLEKIASAIR